jgi:hypothetical protein
MHHPYEPFTLELGNTRTVDNHSELTQKLDEWRKECTTKNKPQPLPFPDFASLINTGVLTKIPQESDPFIYRDDIELRRNDTELRLLYPTRSPSQTRALRRNFLFAHATETALKSIAHEKTILTHARPLVHARTPDYSDYVAYLTQFHKEDLAAFFRPWALPVSSQDLKAHAYLVAGSGHGKSELLKTMMYGLLKQKQGVILFDPHGDIAEQVAHWQEFSREPDRLIYFAPKLAGDHMHTVPVINPMTAIYNHRHGDLDNAVENFIKVLDAVVGAESEISFRMANLLKPCLYTLAHEPNATLYDVLDFLAEDPKLDKQGNPTQPTPWHDTARKTLKNRALRDILDTYFSKTYDTTKNAVRDRLRTFLSSDALDRCLAGTNTIDLVRAMDAGKFIIFNLGGGTGEETSAMFGRFLLGAIQNNAMQRHSQNKDDRRSVFMFLDEGDLFISESVEKIYKQARKYALHITLAQQVAGAGMSERIKNAVFGNSRVRIVGTGGADKDHVRKLAHMVDVEAGEISTLPAHTFYAKRNSETPAVRFTVPSLLTDHKNAMSATEWERVKAYQLEHYYRPFDGANRHTDPNQKALRCNDNQNDRTHTTKHPTAPKPPINFD